MQETIEYVPAGIMKYPDGSQNILSATISHEKRVMQLNWDNTQHWRGFPYELGKDQVGGPWAATVQKTENDVFYLPQPIRGFGTNVYSTHRYSGFVTAGDSTLVNVPGTLDGHAWGAEAYNRMKPTAPVFRGLNAVYELKDVPEMLRQRFVGTGLKDISNYWLALKFGWQPLLSDIRSVISFQRDAQKKLNWLLKHNNRPVRRRVDLASTTTYSTRDNGEFDYPNPSFVSYFYDKMHSQFTRKTEDRVWACARFRYHLPDGPMDIAYKRIMLARLFGLTPTPQYIYNAVPWTWLGDWFFNTSECLGNMDSGVADRLAADWFYVMRQMSFTEIATKTGNFCGADGAKIPFNLKATRTANSYSRLLGDPFGWGTKQSSLSPMQLSILGALGLSRLL